MGDTATIDKKKIKATDTLLVQRYLCGYSCQSCVTRVTIQNERDEVIAESKNEGNSFTFTGKIPVSDIIHSKAFNNSQVLAVYFTIKDKAENMDQTVLLGRLRFR